MSRSQILAIFCLLIISSLIYHHELINLADSPTFVVKPVNSQKFESMVIFESKLIPQPKYLPRAHSSAFTSLKNGDLLAFWFAGTKEGSPDVNIWHSVFHANKWSMATSLVNPRQIAKANNRYVVKVGNPVVYLAKNGVLHLFVVSVSVGGWSGSAINHLISKDNGKTWSEPKRLVLTPFFNLSTLVRTSAAGLEDGGFLLPVYYEMGRKYPEVLRFDKNGEFLYQTRITTQSTLLQPSLVPIDSKTAFSYFRNGTHNGKSNPIYFSITKDGGNSWSKLQKTNLVNRDSSLEVINLYNGWLLMVYNPGVRAKLVLAISKDGFNWRNIYTLENRSNGEFSYPAMQINNGVIDLLYTYNIRRIKHVRFNLTWLNKVAKNELN